MKKQKSNLTDEAILRQKAEELLRAKASKGFAKPKTTESDLLRLVHELQVHQIELEMQNEELLIAKERAELAEEKYSDLYDFAPSGYLALTKEGDISVLNLAAARLLGSTRSYLINKKFALFVSPDTRLSFNRFSQEIFKSRIKHSCQIVIIDKDNLPLYINIDGIISENNQLCILTLTDVSIHVRDQEALRKKEALQMKMVSNIGDVIVIIDKWGINRYKSPNVEALFGWKPEELVGKNTWDNVHPDDLKKGHDFIESLADKPNSKGTIELRYRRGDGSYVWIEITVVNLFHDPDVGGLLGNYHDISERIRIENSLREKDLQFRKLSSNAPVVIYQITRRDDRSYCVPISSDRITNIFGCLPEDLVDTFDPISRVIHPEDLEKFLYDIEYSAEYLTPFSCEFRVRVPGRNNQCILTNSIPEKLPDGSVTWYGFFADITDKKRIEGELQKLAKLESLGILAGGIAHNFKNILTTISLSAELARIKPNRTEYHLDKITKSISQASALATRFQTFSKCDSPVLSATQINETIKEACEISLAGSRANIYLNLDSNLPDIMADEKQMNEVFTNLLINADQAMPNGGNINISTRYVLLQKGQIVNLPDGKYICIEIKDEGGGIPKSIINEIFTPFFTTKSDGQGLGLASVFFIIEKHNGAINVETEIDKGTNFIIYLPIGICKKMNIEFEELAVTFDKRLKILLLDDDVNITSNFEEMARELNFNMLCMNDPRLAIEQYEFSMESEPLDLVILDLTLKGYSMGGLDVLNELKKLNPRIKALVFSGHSSRPIVADYEKYGFVGRIEKPINWKQFNNELDRIQRLINAEKNQ